MNLVWSVLAVVLGFVLATWVGTPVVKGLIRHIDRAGARRRPAPREDGVEIDTRALLGLQEAAAEMPGGEWIGLLERAAAYVCVLTGSTAGLALVLAVKALGRYADLRTPNEARGERFIIGTFASMLWAAACAGVAMVAHWGIGFL